MKYQVKTSRDAGGYCRAWCPALPGCFAYAPSRDEAVAKLQETIESYLASFDAPLAGLVELTEAYAGDTSQRVGP
ncbi:MAG: type II toxin-antitoxin system HicB family antitoxin [Phycisphaerae bacterium]|nr:type II toxin-antitoxin system HicB family antitoxin [Phycisphaerae bacterium]